MTSRLRRWLSLCALALATLAPTAGDIGGCGQQPELLDEVKFFNTKQVIDCDQCIDCNLLSEA